MCKKAFSARDVFMDLRRFGLQRPPDGPIATLDYVPNPGEFYRDYVLPRRPVMFKGAQAKSVAVRNWTDSYLRDHYGHNQVLIEAKYENRNNDPRRTSLARFLQTYDKENMYVVTETPKPMHKDVLALNCLMCGSLSITTEETNFWMSSGGTRSMVHHDADTLINCVIAGRKEWMFMDWEHKFDLDMQQERGHPTSSGSDFSNMDPDRVDLRRYPKVRDIPWHSAVAEAGDCVYLPFRHLHQVRSFDRNVAVSVMFLHPDQSHVPFNEDGCPMDGTPLPDVSLDKHDFVWVYPGDGPITMGYMSPWVIRQFVLVTFFDNGKRTTAPYDKVVHWFRDRLCEPDPDDERGPASNVEPLRGRVKKFLKLINMTRGKVLHLDEAMKWTRPTLKKIAMLADPPHDTMREEELEDELGFPLERAQTDGTKSGPRTRMQSERHLRPGDDDDDEEEGDDEDEDFHGDFDQYVTRDLREEEQPLPIPIDTKRSDAKDYDTPRAHLDDFRV